MAWSDFLARDNRLTRFLDRANPYAQQFEAGSRFGLFGGESGPTGRLQNAFRRAGNLAGALTLLPGAAVKAIQAAKVALTAGKTAEAAQILRGAGLLNKGETLGAKLTQELKSSGNLFKGPMPVARGTLAGGRTLLAGVNRMASGLPIGGEGGAGTMSLGGEGGAGTMSLGDEGSYDPSGSFGVTGSASSTYQPDMVEYPPGSGIYYDLNNPQEREAFFQLRLQDLTGARDEQLASIDQELANLGMSAEDYVRQYFNELENFEQAKNQGDIARADVFSRASPNAFQSSEGTSAQLANQRYLEGIGEAAEQAQDAVGADFLRDPRNLDLLGENTVYGRQRADLIRGRNQVGEEYNQYLRGIEQQNDPSTNPFRFNYQAAGLQAPRAVNLGNYNQFVDFRSVPAGTVPGQNFQPRGRNVFTSQTPLDSFLGRNAVSDRDKDFLRNWLLGRA